MELELCPIRLPQAEGNHCCRTISGYRTLNSFRLVQLVYDVTVRFCEPYLDRRSHTVDQMIQADAFERERGFTERMYRIRNEKRKK